MIYSNAIQGSDDWLAARKGVITGSRFKDARARLADKAGKPTKIDKKTGKILAPEVAAQRGEPSAKMVLYARDVARERCGGKAATVFINGAMRFGTEQEPLARIAYEALTGNLVEEAGFITDDSRIFGVSVDGLVGEEGMVEIKTMVGSDNLFAAVVDGDYSEFIDQINGALWILGREWCDLILWAPDLEELGLSLTVHRIHRNEEAIQSLEDDLLYFAAMVNKNENKLREQASKHCEPQAC